MSIKYYIQDIRYGSIARRKKALIVTTISVLILILLLWVFVFGIQTAVSQKNTSETTNTSDTPSDFVGPLKEVVQYAREAFTASMGTISDLPSGDTITPSVQPTPSSSITELR